MRSEADTGFKTQRELLKRRSNLGPTSSLGRERLRRLPRKTQRLAIYARQKLPEFENDPEKLSAVKNEIRELIHKLELAQHRGATSIEDGKPPQAQH
jgi:hypothetical protein